MQERCGFFDRASSWVLRGSRITLPLLIGGSFDIKCVRPDGKVRWRDKAKNGVTNTALNSVLDVYLGNQTQIASWYIGLVDNSGFSAFAAADTASSHSGWSETTAYTESTRPQWSPAAASSQSVTNTSTVDFSINATKTIRGLFLISNSTKGGTSGTLFSTASFSGGNQSVNSGDTLKVTYTVSAASS